MSNKFDPNEATKLYEKFKSTDESKIDQNELSLRNKGSLKKVWNNVQTLYKVATSKNIPLSVKSTAVGALLYVIFPLDAIPDITPLFGYADDAAVVSAAIFNLKSFLSSPTGRELLKTSAKAVSITAKKTKEISTEFIKSNTGQEMIKVIKAYMNDASTLANEEIQKHMSNVFQKDTKFGYSFFEKEEGKAILNMKGEDIIDGIKTDYIDSSVIGLNKRQFTKLLAQNGAFNLANSLDYTLNTIKDVVKAKAVYEYSKK